MAAKTVPEQAGDESLPELREQINDLDGRLARLLNERAELSLAVGRYKSAHSQPVLRPFREQALLEHLSSLNKGPLSDEQLRAVFREIICVSRQLQAPQRVACLGPAGTFSHLAGKVFLGRSTAFQFEPDLVSVFETVAEGGTALGITPLENSLHGSVGQCLDLFLLQPVHIVAEFYFRIQHSLLSRETELSKIKLVYSHAQGLAQCAEWLRRNLPGVKPVGVDSTAEAARLASEEPGAAAIAHADTGQDLDLAVLAQGIADRACNHTRFALLAPGRLENDGAAGLDLPAAGQAAKTSLLFTLPDRPGALSSTLNILSQAQINLNKLESRPWKGEDWAYVFFADVTVNLLGSAYERVLRDLKNSAHELRILGVYPPGKTLSQAEAPAGGAI